MKQANVIVPHRNTQKVLPRADAHPEDLDTLCGSWAPPSDKVESLLARSGVVLIGPYPHGHVSVIRGDEEPFGELTDAGNPCDVNLLIPCQGVEGVLDVLLDVCSFNNENLSFSGRGGHFLIIKPDML